MQISAKYKIEGNVELITSVKMASAIGGIEVKRLESTQLSEWISI